MRSSLSMLNLKDDKLEDSEEVVGGNEFHSWEILGMKEDLWARVCGLGSVTWKRYWTPSEVCLLTLLNKDGMIKAY